MGRTISWLRTASFLLVALFLVLPGLPLVRSEGATQRVIVQATSADFAAHAVQTAGGRVLDRLDLIHAVSAELSTSASATLNQAGLRVTPDYPVQATADYVEALDSPAIPGRRDYELYPSAAVEAYPLFDENITGRGITVAFIDSGMPALRKERDWTRVDNNTLRYTHGSHPFFVYRDQLATAPISNSSDPYGHGTHVMMTVRDQRKVRAIPNGPNSPAGVAPETNVVMVRALDAQGRGDYSTVIAAIQWIVQNKNTYNIRVLNLSLDGQVAAPYWYDPLGQAVMRAWQSGLVVVAAAGNSGPNPMTIGVPGNVPYVITVGAIKSGRYTPSGEDELAIYSSAGPTESKFIKPDMLVPASQTIAVLPTNSTLVTSGSAGAVFENRAPVLGPSLHLRDEMGYYKVSGTSMASAEVSGIVALLLQANPSLTNDQVKHRLTVTANPAGSEPEGLYSVWQQGAGRVDTVAAVHGTSTESANAGMDIARDLLGEDPSAQHYLGPTAYDAATNEFYLPGDLEAGGYTIWGGDYQAWASDYTIWGGDYTIWGGDYTIWGGSYTIWGGSYQAWASSYTIWGGIHQTWGTGFRVQSGNLVQE